MHLQLPSQINECSRNCCHMMKYKAVELMNEWGALNPARSCISNNKFNKLFDKQPGQIRPLGLRVLDFSLTVFSKLNTSSEIYKSKFLKYAKTYKDIIIYTRTDPRQTMVQQQQLWAGRLSKAYVLLRRPASSRQNSLLWIYLWI